MVARQTTIQTPRPEVKIYDPDSKKPKLEFDTSKRRILREYSFKTAVDDPKGQFSITFYPDEENETRIFNQINILDVVEIYESKNHFKQYYKDGDMVKETIPTFTGIVRSKKYAANITGTSTARKIVISGHSVAGLITEFRMNMDTSAQIITETLAAQENIAKSLTISLLEKNNPRKLEEVLKIIWEEFIKLSTRHGKLSNPKIYKILENWCGDIFDIDKTISLHYPLGCIFDAKTTQGFMDIIEGIVPQQVYEKFVFMDRAEGQMKLKIRECPFDTDKWEELKNHECYEVPTRLIKAMDIEQNDNEVYTVFFSYLDGYPVQMEKLIILTKQNQESASYPGLQHDDEKYSKYGYRPLFVSFIGYSIEEGEDDSSTEEKLQELNEKLMNWYNNLELMYNGQLTLSTDLSMDMPQAGETVSVLGGEFYVTSAEHRWNYKGNPETILQLSRGGDYSGGSFQELFYLEKDFRFLPNNTEGE